LKRFVARYRKRLWQADMLAGLSAAPTYQFPDQEHFDSDDVEILAQRICATQLSLPHEGVIFEVTDRGPRYFALIAFAWTSELGVEACLLMRPRWTANWTDVLCHAVFGADGWANVELNPALANDATAMQNYASALTGIVWRALAILSHAGTVSEHVVSRVHRAKLARSGVSGWSYRVVDIDPVRAKAAAQGVAGTHVTPRWHIRRGHWRRLADGRRVFVRECEVGDAARGGVVKDYSIKMGDAA
jgi:hypothetical protein